ncbi:SCO0607 family lipoprotein [Streptacidiphilus sp. N1-12]|uniref:SCO0607 family lipoprotein n=2 Tax=Streptacidiphilus alkalitolerans TaxID=3342712 RepID=A0ABV6VLX2_9ACTN
MKDSNGGGLRRTLVLLVVGTAVGGLTAACSLDTRDAVCRGSEYPVASVGSPGGGACVSNGKQPPTGYVRYPEGQVPQHVDDKWDTYWSTHALDDQGRLVGDPR